jgi:hypothetical protein
MLRRYGDKAIEESATRADELAAQDDYQGPATLRPLRRALSNKETGRDFIFLRTRIINAKPRPSR